MAKKQVKKTVAKKQKNEKVKEKKIDKKEPKVVEKIKTEKTISSSGETIIKKDISSEIINRMMPYALSVIESRALPFIEDGFKPSQRFWLYGMKMSGADGERTIKSGEIEGVVMGKLNPHAGAYLTGVRLTDGAESLLTPYIYGEGNFGKHYSENIKEAAARYCITGNSIINTEDGFVRIEDIIKNTKLSSTNKLNKKVKTYNGKINASKLFNSGEHEVYTVIANNGMNITGTSNHPLLCLTNNFELIWKTIEELKIGDTLLVDTNTSNTMFGKNNDLLEAAMLGCMISEGCITTQNRICINNKDIDMISPVQKYFKREINSEGSLTNKRNVYELTISCKDYYNNFIEKFEYGKTAEIKHFPKCALKGTKEYLKTLLKYLFEGDGSIVVNNGLLYSKERQSIMYASKSKQLIDEIQYILSAAFGIYSTRNYDKRNGCIILRINDYKSLLLFKNNIGFVSKRKNDILNKIEAKKLCNNTPSCLMSLDKFIKSKNSKIKKTIKFVEDFDKYKKELYEYLDKTDIEYLDYILHNYKFSKIIKIQHNDTKKIVYSIKVDDDFHAFSANGFINHNTEMKLNKLGKEIVLGSTKYHPSNIESNFNGCYQQPKFLGAAFPNILANPQQGIAVGYACQWGSFNLKELCEATKYIIKNKAKADKDLVNKVLEIMPTMDFSSGGETDLNKEELTNIYLNGEGKIVLRARFENNQKERVLEIFEIPYVTNAENIANAIIKAVDSGKITEVSDVRNETGLNKKTGEATLKIAIDYKSGTDVEELKKKLFALTSCQANLNVNMFGLYNNIPAKYGVINCIKKWIEFRENWLKEEFTEILKELKDRLHLLEGLEKILVDIDKAVKIVKNSKTDEEVITGLMKGFKLDEVQAEFVANIKLRNFNKDYILNKIKEIKDLKNQIKDYENKLKDINSEMINQLDETIKNYGIDRKTIISKEKWEELPVITTRTKEPEKLDGDSMVFTGSDWAKRVPSDSGAKAPNGSEKVVAPNNGELLIFCNTAKVFKWTIGKLKNNTQTKITDIKKIAKKLEGGDQILYVTPLIEKRKIVIFFDNGKAAKIPESAWSTESSKLLFKKGRYDKANILHIEAIDKDKIIEIAGKKYDTSKIKEVGNKTGQGAKVKPEK